MTKKNDYSFSLDSKDILAHHGVPGMKWYVRRYQNYDGTLTEAGKKRYSDYSNYDAAQRKEIGRQKKINSVSATVNTLFSSGVASAIGSQLASKAAASKATLAAQPLIDAAWAKTGFGSVAAIQAAQAAKSAAVASAVASAAPVGAIVGGAVGLVTVGALTAYGVKKYNDAVQKGNQEIQKIIDSGANKKKIKEARNSAYSNVKKTQMVNVGARVISSQQMMQNQIMQNNINMQNLMNETNRISMNAGLESMSLAATGGMNPNMFGHF